MSTRAGAVHLLRLQTTVACIPQARLLRLTKRQTRPHHMNPWHRSQHATSQIASRSSCIRVNGHVHYVESFIRTCSVCMHELAQPYRPHLPIPPSPPPSPPFHPC